MHVAEDQAVLDEHFAGLARVDGGERDDAGGDEDQAVEGDAFGNEGRGGFAVPARVGVGAFDQVCCGTFDPLRLNRCAGAGVELGGFDEFAGDDPFLFLAEKRGAGEDVEADVARGEVFVGVGLCADVGGCEAGEQGARWMASKARGGGVGVRGVFG